MDGRALARALSVEERNAVVFAGRAPDVHARRVAARALRYGSVEEFEAVVERARAKLVAAGFPVMRPLAPGLPLANGDGHAPQVSRRPSRRLVSEAGAAPSSNGGDARRPDHEFAADGSAAAGGESDASRASRNGGEAPGAAVTAPVAPLSQTLPAVSVERPDSPAVAAVGGVEPDAPDAGSGVSGEARRQRVDAEWRYLELLFDVAARPGCPEHVFDRLERLIGVAP